MLRIHLLACPCGSIMSGHRRAEATMIAFSTEKRSLGRPAMFHARILTGSPRVLTREKRAPHGTRCARTRRPHAATASRRCTASKGPRYATAAALSNTSPVAFTSCADKRVASCSHLVFSPPSPAISFSARTSLRSQSATSSSSWCLRFIMASSRRRRSATLASTLRSSACFSRKPAMTTSYSACATRSFSFLGSTILATR
mmetsp:Transcript_29030/g.94592  ORF Transcript_29030/g.94592 Transcript_29030/m.94592 type:complete len:201 (-) Transcript_29030:930-1532(-)